MKIIDAVKSLPRPDSIDLDDAAADLLAFHVRQKIQTLLIQARQQQQIHHRRVLTTDLFPRADVRLSSYGASSSNRAPSQFQFSHMGMQMHSTASANSNLDGNARLEKTNLNKVYQKDMDVPHPMRLKWNWVVKLPSPYSRHGLNADDAITIRENLHRGVLHTIRCPDGGLDAKTRSDEMNRLLETIKAEFSEPTEARKSIRTEMLHWLTHSSGLGSIFTELVKFACGEIRDCLNSDTIVKGTVLYEKIDAMIRLIYWLSRNEHDSVFSSVHLILRSAFCLLLNTKIENYPVELREQGVGVLIYLCRGYHDESRGLLQVMVVNKLKGLLEEAFQYEQSDTEYAVTHVFAALLTFRQLFPPLGPFLVQRMIEKHGERIGRLADVCMATVENVEHLEVGKMARALNGFVSKTP